MQLLPHYGWKKHTCVFGSVDFSMTDKIDELEHGGSNWQVIFFTSHRYRCTFHYIWVSSGCVYTTHRQSWNTSIKIRTRWSDNKSLLNLNWNRCLCFTTFLIRLLGYHRINLSATKLVGPRKKVPKKSAHGRTLRTTQQHQCHIIQSRSNLFKKEREHFIT